jgi:asparagine synthase (glutamine-hydrolysing)
MCGLAGFYDPIGRYNTDTLRLMTQKVAHRGPDAEGFYHEGPCGLGHKRLNIIDLNERSNQPMHSASGRYVIVYNGEVYNHREIGASLRNVSHAQEFTPRTSSDTEIILESFVMLGENFIHQLNGMFAFAIYDKETEELYLYRDRLGIKPLFYYINGDTVVFASELKSITAIVGKDLTIREESIHEFLHMGFISSPNTIYNEVFKLESGCFLKISKKGVNKFRYWGIRQKITNNIITNKEQALVKLSDIIMSSVQYQLKSDVPFGVFLSGGIDSSLVTAQAVGLSSIKVKTFSIGFEENSHNESEYAKAVAKYLNTDHQEFIVSYTDAIDLIETAFDIYDEPFGDSSSIPTMLVSKLAKKYVTVTLSGEGGDELFFGYGSHQWARRFASPGFTPLRYFSTPLLNRMSSRYKRIANLLNISDISILRSHIFSQEQYLFSVPEICEMIADERKFSFNTFTNLNSNQSLHVLAESDNKGKIDVRERQLNAMESQALFDLQYYLQDDLLTKVDRASMHYSLETRVPYLDHRLVELSINTAPDLKYRKNTTKFILKEILFQYLPRHMFLRPKQGFAIPLNRWLLFELRFLIDSFLSDEVLKKHGIVRVDKVRELVNRFRAGENYLYNRIWLLIVLHYWLEKHHK